jgi:hypothetical protein
MHASLQIRFERMKPAAYGAFVPVAVAEGDVDGGEVSGSGPVSNYNRDDMLIQYLKKLSAIASRYDVPQQESLFSSPLFYRWLIFSSFQSLFFLYWE